MKRFRLKGMVALAFCAGALALNSASAQEYTVSTWSELDGSGEGSLVIERFGVRNGELVAYGRMVPSTTIHVDESAWGNWTGIASGYGESGVESRSDMISDYDGPVSMSLNRSTGVRSFDLQMGPTSGNDRVARGIDLQFGPTSGNDRVATGIDLQFGPTSGNDRTSLDVQMGPTSENDRTAIDLKMGPTSGNDRVAGGPIDLHFGPTSGNDRTSIDARMGPTSANDRTRIDAELGATSSNDRTAPLMLSSSTVVVPVDVVSSSCEQVVLSFADGRTVVMTPSTSEMRSSFCAFAGTEDSAVISAHLNGLILGIE